MNRFNQINNYEEQAAYLSSLSGNKRTGNSRSKDKVSCDCSPSQSEELGQSKQPRLPPEIKR